MGNSSFGSNVPPGAVVTVLICGYTLLNWPHGQLIYGAKSLGETLHSVAHSSFLEVNSSLANPIIRYLLELLKRWLLSSLGIFTLLGAAPLLKKIQRLVVGMAESHSRLLTISIAMHAVSHYWFGLLMPLGRTALFIAPLLILMAALVAMAQPTTRAARLAADGIRISFAGFAI